MKFGVSLAGIYDTPNYLEQSMKYVKLIEELNFDSVWTGDSQMLHRDAYCDLALWAANTEKVKLGPCVSNPFTRHASVTASAILTIDEISHGRAILGIGVGDSSVRRIGLQPRPVAELESSVRVIRKLCNGKSVNFEGQDLKIRWGRPRDVPIFVAGSGTKSLQAAGRVGNGVIVNTGPSEEGIRFGKDNVAIGAKEEGRDPKEIEMVQFLFSSIDKSKEDAVRDAKPFVTWYLVNIPDHPIVKNEKLSEEVSSRISTYRANYYKYDEDSSHHSASWESSVKESTFIPDDLVEKYTLSGTPEQFVSRLRGLEDKGVDHVIFRPPFTERFEESLKMLGEVVSEFR